jgi:hypothetical protein
MIVPQPQTTDPRIAAIPTGPVPRMAIDDPGGGLSPFMTVPAPV